LKNRIFAGVFLFFSFNIQVFSFGRSQANETEIQKQNTEWTLCVTEFDAKSMPQSKLSVASVITRKVVERLNEISYRTRVSPEYAYYEGYAWYKARSEAAKKLSAKLEERSLLIYNGERAWRYKQNLARVDAEIEKLTAAFKEIDNNAPAIETEPVFKLTERNVLSEYPEPPEKGNEFKFCKDQKADAFLSGKIIDFHGRYNISIKLYAVYTKTFIYEDSIIFSPDDLDSALSEILSRLILTLSGSRHAAIAVKTEPADALVLINRSFAGRGDLGIIERPPGKFEITASANEHESISIETELGAGEIAEIKIKLIPQEFIDIEIPGTAEGAAVYRGALYVGQTPLTLRLPVNTMEYVEMESGNGLRGTAVFNTPEGNDPAYSLSVKNRKPPVKGKVERARTMYYWAWGGLWVTGIASWITHYNFTASNSAIKYNYYQTAELDQRFYDDNIRNYNIRNGTFIALGAVSVFWVVTMVRYLYLANRGSTPVVKPGKSK